MSNFTRTFTGAEDFDALHAAEAFLSAAGFAYGSLERGSPVGIMFGDYQISKWRNMNDSEIAALHGRMTGQGGSMRAGPVTVTIFDTAPREALEACERACAVAPDQH